MSQTPNDSMAWTEHPEVEEGVPHWLGWVQSSEFGRVPTLRRSKKKQDKMNEVGEAG